MKRAIIFSICLLTAFACSSKNEGNGEVKEKCLMDFNRREMLMHWADEIIVPNYKKYEKNVDQLYLKIEQFLQSPTQESLQQARQSLLSAYTLWQTVAFYNVGPADTKNMIVYTNTYPANVQIIKENIEQERFSDLHLPSRASQQGFPAIDYLLNGIAQDDAAILAIYQGEKGEKNRKYLLKITQRLKKITNEVVDSWGEYRNVFVNNDGSSATASVDLMANAFLLYYEAYLRNPKVRFPSGATTGVVSPERVESLYTPSLSLPLLINSLTAMQNFFNGKATDVSKEGLSFKTYLDKSREITKGQDIAKKINEGFTNAITKAQALEKEGTLKQIIERENKKIVELHDIIQANVIPMKVDMLQAMCIAVHYADGDGD